MADEPTYDGLIEAAEKLAATGNLPSKEQAERLQAAVAKLVDPTRGATMDFSDPANSGLAGTI